MASGWRVMSRRAEKQRSRRQQFAAPGGSFDRMIRILRIALPLGVGVLIAILLIAPMANRGELSFVLDKKSVERAPERLQAANALYRGADDKGRPFALQAGSAVQHNETPGQVQLNDLSARMTLDDGPAAIRAGEGIYDIEAQTASVPGQIRFEAEPGYRLDTSNATIAFGPQTLTSQGGVTGVTDMGSFTGDRMSADLAARKLVISGNVTGTTKVGPFRAERLTVDLAKGTIALDGGAKVHVIQGRLR